MTDPVLHEALVLWPAWGVLAGHVSRTHPAEADPQSIYGAAMACEQDRLAALLYAHIGATESMEDAANLLADLLLMAQSGVRPRFGREIGLNFGGAA